MAIYNDFCPDAADIEELFPRQPQPLVARRAADILKSNVIMGFEQAIEHGMGPMDALATILGWVSSEMARIDLGHATASLNSRK